MCILYRYIHIKMTTIEEKKKDVKTRYCDRINGTLYRTPESEKFKRIFIEYIKIREQEKKAPTRVIIDTSINGKRALVKYITDTKPTIDVCRGTQNVPGVDVCGTDDQKITNGMYQLKRIILTQLRNPLTYCIVYYTIANTPIGGVEQRGFGEESVENIISLCKNKEHDIDMMMQAFSLGVNGDITIKCEESLDKLGQDCITDYLEHHLKQKQKLMEDRMLEDQLQWRVKQWENETKHDDYKNIPHMSLGGHDCLQPCRRRPEAWPPHTEWGKNVCACPIQKWNLWKGTYNTVDKCPENQCSL